MVFVFSLIVLLRLSSLSFFFFFFNDTATTEIYTLSLHDALPISLLRDCNRLFDFGPGRVKNADRWPHRRSEEHTSELQSRLHLVCRLLLEKKKKKINMLLCSHTTRPLHNRSATCTASLQTTVRPA